MYTLNHHHPTLGLIYSATNYESYEAALADMEAGQRFTDKKFKIEPMEIKSQKNSIKKALLNGTKVSWENIREVGGQMAEIGARISDLRNEGLEITAEWHTYINGEGDKVKCKQYSMSEDAISDYLQQTKVVHLTQPAKTQVA